MQLRPRQRVFVGSRAEAKAAGAKCYSHGKPCFRNHAPVRYTSNKCCVACLAAYQASLDRASERARVSAWYAENRDLRRAKLRAYAKTNGAAYRHREALRRAALLQATPKWANLKAIGAIYASCPPGHHVDHIVPLRGRTVCGLHVENNLQHLEAEANRRKQNRWGGDDCAA